ncbi:MAG: hypothetical protein V1729_02975 [Candidatus Woesearchaeota archaeon]
MSIYELVMDEFEYLAEMREKQTFPLHLHWDGSIPAKDIFNLAQQRGETLYLPDKDKDGRRIHYDSPQDKVIDSPEMLEKFFHDLRDYQMVDVFGKVTQFMQTDDDLKATALALCSYLKEQNSPYAEVRFAPFYHTFGGMSMEDVIRSAVAGFKAGKKLTGVDARLIICINREATPEDGVKIADAAIAVNREYPDMVLGIDLACEESLKNPPEKHLAAFKRTFNTPLKRTVHAGEMCDEVTNLNYIRTALYDLRAHAISHAVPLHKDEAIIKYVVKNRIRLESNPICNWFFFDKSVHDDLRLDKLLAKGVLVTINPDDPAMIPRGHTVDNLALMARLYGRGIVDQLIANSIESAWGLDDVQKKNYLSRLDL